jgi:mRNA interferase MazF
MHRGEVWDADIPRVGRHPVVVVSRESALPVLRSVVCVTVSSTHHGHVAEVELNADEGLDHASAANCDDLLGVRREWFVRRRGHVGPAKLRQLDDALRLALDL